MSIVNGLDHVVEQAGRLIVTSPILLDASATHAATSELAQDVGIPVLSAQMQAPQTLFTNPKIIKTQTNNLNTILLLSIPTNEQLFIIKNLLSF